MDNNTLSNALKAYRMGRMGYNVYNSLAGAGGSEAATAAATGAGESSLSGLGGASWAAYTPYLSLIAPALMTYLAYTGGSHRNEPVEKRMETIGSMNYLGDLAKGKKVDPNSIWANYRLNNSYNPDIQYDNPEAQATRKRQSEMGYTPSELLDLGIGYSVGRAPGHNNSGFTPDDIYNNLNRLGVDNAALTRLTGQKTPWDEKATLNNGFTGQDFAKWVESLRWLPKQGDLTAALQPEDKLNQITSY